MLEALFIGALLILLVVQQILSERRLKAERAHHSKREDASRDHVRHLEDQIVLLKVEPHQAAAQASPPSEDRPVIPVDDSPYADAAWDKYMAEHS